MGLCKSFSRFELNGRFTPEKEENGEIAQMLATVCLGRQWSVRHELLYEGTVHVQCLLWLCSPILQWQTLP